MRGAKNRALDQRAAKAWRKKKVRTSRCFDGERAVGQGDGWMDGGAGGKGGSRAKRDGKKRKRPARAFQAHSSIQATGNSSDLALFCSAAATRLPTLGDGVSRLR